jgi:ubiquinone/menaquinone biosynthesis C-methylase UbiE
MPEKLPDYAVANRALWTNANAKYTAGRARDSWAATEISWGIWKKPETELRVLPNMKGRDVIELGCGTAYFGAWLKKAGARRVVGVDVTPAQLETARQMNAEFGLGLEFIEANAEDVPLPDASFDIAFSEYGASIWCDALRWIPEAARLLRPGGELIFLRSSDLQLVCSADEDKVSQHLVRPLQGMNRLEWTDPDGSSVEFHLSISDMFRLLRRTGFDILDFRELYAGDSAIDHSYYSYVPVAWARQWPAEEIWRARKTR